MGKDSWDPLATFNQLYKEMDEIYHQYARGHGNFGHGFVAAVLPLSERCALYQREICSEWHYPPQTLNSALKTLERQELISLEPAPGNQKNKQVVLTEKGNSVVQQIISPLVSAERQSFHQLEEGEKEALLSLTRKYVEVLRSNVQKICSSSAR